MKTKAENIIPNYHQTNQVNQNQIYSCLQVVKLEKKLCQKWKERGAKGMKATEGSIKKSKGGKFDKK